jgi:hypothetical protein
MRSVRAFFQPWAEDDRDGFADGEYVIGQPVPGLLEVQVRSGAQFSPEEAERFATDLVEAAAEARRSLGQ